MRDILKKLSAGKEEKVMVIHRHRSEYNSDIAHIHICFGYFDQEKYDGSGLGFYDFGDKNLGLKYLRVESQFDRDNSVPYGHALKIGKGYESPMTIDEADKALKVAKSVQKKMDKIIELEGHPKSYQDYVMILARALNVKKFYAKQDLESPNSQQLQCWALNHLRSKIESFESEIFTAIGNPVANKEEVK